MEVLRSIAIKVCESNGSRRAHNGLLMRDLHEKPRNHEILILPHRSCTPVRGGHYLGRLHACESMILVVMGAVGWQI